MRCSHRRATALICLINVLIIVCIVHGLLTFPQDLQITGVRPRAPSNGTLLPVSYTREEKERINEAEEARRAVEPVKLINRLKEMQVEATEDADLKSAQQNVVVDLAQLIRDRNEHQSSLQGEGRNPMDLGTGPLLEAVRLSPRGGKSDSRLIGGKLVLKGPEIEDGIIPGIPLPKECNAEPHTDYDGIAVTWGLTNPKKSAAECCHACLDQARTAKEGDKKCNIWVYCPAEEGCYSPDIYEHRHFECWLKQAETPTINFKGRYSPEYRQGHGNCPQVVAWASGVISPA